MMANIFNFLNILIWLPIFSGIAVLLISYTEMNIFKKSDVLHYFSLLMSLIIFFFGIVLYINYDSGNAALQFVQRLSWIDSLGVEYHIGIDGISLALFLLTTFMTPLVILSSWESIKKRPYQYFSAFLILDWRFFIFGRNIILCFLGSNVGANVFDYRHLGWEKKNICNA